MPVEVTDVIEWVQMNGWVVFGAQYVFSCFVQALPEPDTRSGNFYVFVYRFSHALAGNTKVVGKPLRGSI